MGGQSDLRTVAGGYEFPLAPVASWDGAAFLAAPPSLFPHALACAPAAGVAPGSLASSAPACPERPPYAPGDRSDTAMVPEKVRLRGFEVQFAIKTDTAVWGTF